MIRCLAIILVAATAFPITAASSAPVTVTIIYSRRGPSLDLTSDPAFRFRCSERAVQRRCITKVTRNTLMTLRARTHSGQAGDGVSALSLPIDGAAWGGACAGTPADVCRLYADHNLTVRIDNSDH